MLKDLRQFAAQVTAESKEKAFVNYEDTAEAAMARKASARAYVFENQDFKDSKQALEYLVNTLNYGFEKMNTFKMAVMRDKARLILAEAAYGILLLMIDRRKNSTESEDEE